MTFQCIFKHPSVDATMLFILYLSYSSPCNLAYFAHFSMNSSVIQPYFAFCFCFYSFHFLQFYNSCCQNSTCVLRSLSLLQYLLSCGGCIQPHLYRALYGLRKYPTGPEAATSPDLCFNHYSRSSTSDLGSVYHYV